MAIFIYKTSCKKKKTKMNNNKDPNKLKLFGSKLRRTLKLRAHSLDKQRCSVYRHLNVVQLLCYKRIFVCCFAFHYNHFFTAKEGSSRRLTVQKKNIKEKEYKTKKKKESSSHSPLIGRQPAKQPAR